MNPIDFDYSKVRGSTTLHNKFKKEFEIYGCKEFLYVMFIPYDVGFVRAYSNPDICYQMGMEGVFDLIVLVPNGCLFFDTKTGGAVLQKNQKAFRAATTAIFGEIRAFKINSCFEGIEIIRRFYGDI